MRVPEITQHTFKSGFTAEVIKRPDFNQKFFGIIVDFGSADQQKIPGCAHFLEHKLFSKIDGDISQKIEELGAEVNAFTSFNETMFYCKSLKHYQQVIPLLFRLVGQPNFTEENVKKESLIIQQELAMYQNSPNWAVTDAIMHELFGDSNLAIDAVGTKKSIQNITVEDITKAYSQNYLANNMKFIACGDFSDYQTQKIFRLVNKYQAEYLSSGDVHFNKEHVKGDFGDCEIETETESTFFGVGIYLENFTKVAGSLDIAQILLEIMLEAKFSVLSSWYEEMKKQKLLLTPLQITVNYTRQGDFATIYGISPNNVQLIEQIKLELAKPIDSLEQTYLEKFFTLKKKEWLAQTARSLNDISFLAIERAEEMLDGENLFKNIEDLQMISFEDFINQCEKMLQNIEVCSAALLESEL